MSRFGLLWLLCNYLVPAALKIVSGSLYFLADEVKYGENSINVLIRAAVDQKNVQAGMKIIRELPDYGVTVGTSSINSLMQLCAKAAKVDAALELLSWLQCQEQLACNHETYRWGSALYSDDKPSLNLLFWYVRDVPVAVVALAAILVNICTSFGIQSFKVFQVLDLICSHINAERSNADCCCLVDTRGKVRDK